MSMLKNHCLPATIWEEAQRTVSLSIEMTSVPDTELIFVNMVWTSGSLAKSLVQPPGAVAERFGGGALEVGPSAQIALASARVIASAVKVSGLFWPGRGWKAETEAAWPSAEARMIRALVPATTCVKAHCGMASSAESKRP